MDESAQHPDIESIVRIAVAALRHELNILTEDEHAFIKAMITRERVRAERWEKIKTQLFGWGLIAFAGWIGNLIVDALHKYFSKGPQ